MNTSICTLCKREVGVSRRAYGRTAPLPEWRITRHRSTEKRNHRADRRETICPGSGILVAESDVNQKVSA